MTWDLEQTISFLLDRLRTEIPDRVWSVRQRVFSMETFEIVSIGRPNTLTLNNIVDVTTVPDIFCNARPSVDSSSSFSHRQGAQPDPLHGPAESLDDVVHDGERTVCTAQVMDGTQWIVYGADIDVTRTACSDCSSRCAPSRPKSFRSSLLPTIQGTCRTSTWTTRRESPSNVDLTNGCPRRSKLLKQIRSR